MTMIVSSPGRLPRTARILATCVGVLADDRARLGVAGDPLALLGRVGRVDRHDDGAGARDAEVRVGPLGPRRAQDRHAVARLDPEVDQAAADLRHDLAELARS